MIVAGSPSYSAVGMTPNSPLPAWKTTMQTIRAVARLQPRAWAFERDCDIVPAPVWRRGPSPPDWRPMRPGLGRDHRGGAASTPHARVENPSRVDRTRPDTGPRIGPNRHIVE